MAVVGRAVRSPHSCCGAEASCGLRAGTTLENTTTGRTCTATTTLIHVCMHYYIYNVLEEAFFISLHATHTMDVMHSLFLCYTYTYNGCRAQTESPQSVQTYCVLVVGLLQDGEEEVRDEMAASVGYILAHVSLSVGM